MAVQVVLVRNNHGKVGGYVDYADATSFLVQAEGHLVVLGKGNNDILAVHAPGQWNSAYVTGAAVEHPAEAIVPVIG